MLTLGSPQHGTSQASLGAEFAGSFQTPHGDLPGDPVVLAALASVLGVGEPRSPLNVAC